jgi:hypothetical protein
VYRDHYGNLLLPRVVSNTPGNGGGLFSNLPDPWAVSPAAAASPLPRRTFHNVIPRGNSGRSPAGGGGSHVSAAAAAGAWAGWDHGMRYSAAHPLHHHHAKPSNDQVLYGEVLYGEGFQPFAAIASNVCLCEDYLGGTQRAAGKRNSGGGGGGGSAASKRCKKCGYERPGPSSGRGGGLRRSASEESVNGHYADPYEYTVRRQQRLMLGQKPVFYDEQDEYDDLGRMQF